MDVGLILSSYNNTFKYYIQQLFNIWKDKGSISILVDLDLKSSETKHSINDAIMIIKNAQELGAKIIVNSKEPNKYTLYKNYLEVFDNFCISSPAKCDIMLSSNAGLEQAMLILQETARYYKLYKMKLTISKNANINYLARIVQVDTFHPHPNADKLKLCTVEGYIISTGIDSVEGIYVYFPVECVINPKFLKYHNLYRKKELNQNPEQSGFFEESGRVKCIKLRGIASEGFIMPNGQMIQKDYDYKCVYNPKSFDYQKMTPKQMYHARLFDIVVYRITYTNVDGKVFEFSTQQVKEFCKKYGLHSVKELYYSRAENLFPNLNINEHWHEEFLTNLRNMYLEQRSILCNNNVPEESIVLRREVNGIDVYKLKSINFLEKESKMLDRGEIDIESNQ